MPADRPPRALLPIFAVLLLACLLPTGRAAAEDPPRPDRLWIGTWPVHPDLVVDGDTLRLPLDLGAIRVVGLDTEEVFKSQRDREAAAQDFAAYAKAKRGDSPYPVKYGTPAGEAAKACAQELAAKATAIRVERDELDAPARGTYGRLLGHVWFEGPGGEVLLAEALIRAGHSPYFVKYGRSRRFDDVFRKAEAEARAARRGIWGTDGPGHYPDYDQRLPWWHARAAQVEVWRKTAAEPTHVTLGSPSADERLGSLVGKDAVVFGLFERELPVSGGDRRVFLLTHEARRGFPLVFFDPAIPGQLDMAAVVSRYLTVRGKVTLYNGRPQMIIESAAQISAQ